MKFSWSRRGTPVAYFLCPAGETVIFVIGVAKNITFERDLGLFQPWTLPPGRQAEIEMLIFVGDSELSEGL